MFGGCTSSDVINKLKDLDSKNQGLETKVKDAEKQVEDFKSELKERSDALAKLSERLMSDEKQIEGIGYFTLGWEYKDIPGARNLSVLGWVSEGGKCDVSGKFTFRGALASQMKISIIANEEIVLSKTVPVQNGSFHIKGVGTDCNNIKNVQVRPGE